MLVVIQITGDLFNVTYALCLVSWKLRTQVFHSERTSYNNGYIPSSDLAQMSTIRQVNISKDGRFSTGIFPWVGDGASLSYEMDSAENTFRSIDFGPPEAQVVFYLKFYSTVICLHDVKNLPSFCII